MSDNHAHDTNKKTLVIAFIIITFFMIVEAFGGFLTNSLALLADAGHMLSDSISLGVAVVALTLGERVANYSKTYGYKRFEILAAVFNGVTLILISGFIFYEAIGRFQNPPEVASFGMLGIAIVGLIVNIIVAFMLHRSGNTQDNLNIRAAFLHVIGDLLGSVGAIIAALLMIFFDWGIADPLASVIVAMLILISGWRVTKDSLHVLMEGAPVNVDLKDVISTIKRFDEVKGIHDLHAWTITSGMNALSAHVVVDGRMTVHESQMLLHKIEDELEQNNIGHVTIQIECKDHEHGDEVICDIEFESETGQHHGHAH
ncbi:cation diffusion facilitator family transporter [Jeotgalicoccus sp. FSL K6-3177]|uniref:cation diffusion facilitator family transporter n=1 Tax=Jeotgalicoccus sp. FSL K6-3177 TaxID=2921494 RepID=UPI001FF7CF8A|nr:cation diffusion facilitator family transporter [Jeotgalicoccus huakuii]